MAYHQLTAEQVANWTLRIGESCARPGAFSLGDLQKKFQHHNYQLQLNAAAAAVNSFRPHGAINGALGQ